MGALVVVVFVLALAVVAGAVWYLRRRLVVDPLAPGRPRRVGDAVLLGAVVLTFGPILVSRLFAGSPIDRVAVVGYVLLAVFFYVLLVLVVAELPRWGWARVERRRAAGNASALGPPTPPTAPVGDDPEPAHEASPAPAAVDEIGSRSVPRAIAAVAVVVGIVTSAFGYVQARDIRMRHVAVSLPEADPGLDGLRIAVLADIHLTAGLRDRAWLEGVVERVNAQEPDLVAVVGDLVDGDVADLGQDAAPLAGLESTYGTFFVTGNHEYISGVDQWVGLLPTLGVQVLRNEHVEIDHEGTTFVVAGVEDVTGERESTGPDIARALEGTDPEQTRILLSHQPVLAEEVSSHGVDLQLSGHTHGGQMWPIHYLVRLQQGHVAGLERVGDMALYTSRGTGSWGPPVRVGAPPEISILTLEAG